MKSSSCCNSFLLSMLMIVSILIASETAHAANENLKLLASDGSAEDLFGNSIAINNGIVAVGAYGSNAPHGSAYIFNSATGAQIAKLLPTDVADWGMFASCIAIADGIVAVGAHHDDVNGTFSGSAYLFNAITGAQVVKLIPSDGFHHDEFGFSIAISNGVVAIGSPTQWNGLNPGSAYLFNASSGNQLLKLTSTDVEAGDLFGFSIAIGDGIVAVAAIYDDDNGTDAGAVYLFNASNGNQLFKLLPDDGAALDHFGHALAINNNIVAVGSIYNDDNGTSSGSAYLFNATTGSQIAKLLANDAAAFDYFGGAISIDNGVVAVAARGDDDDGDSSGSAYIFDASSGAQIAKLTPSDGATSIAFGTAIGIDNGSVVAGAIGDDDNGWISGSAYVFETSTATGGIDLPQSRVILKQNTPNPFNPSTTIRFVVAEDSHVTITVYDLDGLRVRTLVDRGYSSGQQMTKWDGKDASGEDVASGVYFYRMHIGKDVHAKKMILLK